MGFLVALANQKSHFQHVATDVNHEVKMNQAGAGDYIYIQITRGGQPEECSRVRK